jgi:hypothetical protein
MAECRQAKRHALRAQNRRAVGHLEMQVRRRGLVSSRTRAVGATTDASMRRPELVVNRFPGGKRAIANPPGRRVNVKWSGVMPDSGWFLNSDIQHGRKTQ